MENPAESRSITGIKLLFVAAFIIIGLWFVHEIISTLFFFFFAVVLTMVLNAPVMWLMSKRFSRTSAALIVFFLMLISLVAIFWLVIPRLLNQVSSLITNLPSYYLDLKMQVVGLVDEYPALQKKLLDNSSLSDSMPSTRRIVIGAGRFSLSLVGSIFFFIIFLSVVAYMLLNPVPLIETYLLFFPESKRSQAAEALAKSSKMMEGWLWANVVVGLIEAVLVFFFLAFMNVPGIWVWAALALFGQLIPRLGFYIMAVPPILIGLSISPFTSLWVLVFYVVLDEIMADFVMPHIRASVMNLHPVLSLFAMLAMASAFGLTGALVATPFIAFVKAYYETFFLSTVSKRGLKQQVDVVLNRKF